MLGTGSGQRERERQRISAFLSITWGSCSGPSSGSLCRCKHRHLAEHRLEARRAARNKRIQKKLFTFRSPLPLPHSLTFVAANYSFSPASEMSRSTSWSCTVQVKEHLYLQALSCIPFQFLRRDSTSRTCSSSEGRMERWQNSRNTNHLLLDSELVKAKPIFLFCYFLFLTVRTTQLGVACTVLNLMNTLYRWRHRPYFFVCLFLAYFI